MSSNLKLPPRGFYRDGNRVEPLLALAAGEISPPAFSLWHTIALYSWEEGRCHPTNAELGACLHVSPRHVRTLLLELEQAQLLRITYPAGKRWLQIRYGAAAGDEPQFRDELQFGDEAQFRGEPQFTPGTPVHPQVSKLAALSTAESEKLSLLESPDSLREGGVGGGGATPEAQFTPPGTPVQPPAAVAPEPEHAELAARLRQAGLYPALADQRAEQLLAAHDLDTALAQVTAHLRDLDREGVLDRETRARLLQWRLVNTEPTPLEPEISLPEPRLRVAPAQSPEALLWQRVLDDLALSMTHATFDAWLRGSVCQGANGDPHSLVVQVKNEQAVAWLSQRLYPLIERTLRWVGQNEQLTVCFVAR